jgi:hypothetical protein
MYCHSSGFPSLRLTQANAALRFSKPDLARSRFRIFSCLSTAVSTHTKCPNPTQSIRETTELIGSPGLASPSVFEGASSRLVRRDARLKQGVESQYEQRHLVQVIKRDDDVELGGY